MVHLSKTFAAVAVVSLGLGLSTGAHAQAAKATSNVPTSKVEKPWRIKIGAFFPTDGDVKDAIGSTFLSYGVSYDFFKTNVANPITVGAYIDGATNSKKNFGVTDRLTYWGIGPVGRYYFTPVTSPVRIYGGAGVGAYFIDLKSSVSVDGVTYSASDNKDRFGGKLLAGVESGQGLFGELDYTFISKIEDTNPGGWNLGVGYRF
jgi:opacity protein-like surface antigen